MLDEVGWTGPGRGFMCEKNSSYFLLIKFNVQYFAGSKSRMDPLSMPALEHIKSVYPDIGCEDIVRTTEDGI